MGMGSLQHILLDLDGPLLDGKRRHYHCYRTILLTHGYVPIDIDRYWEMKRAKGSRTQLLQISDAEGLYDDFLASWVSMIESPNALALDRIQEGALDCMKQWREDGLTLTLVTMRKNRRALEEQLRATGLQVFLNTVLVCDHESCGAGKADAVREHFQTA